MKKQTRDIAVMRHVSVREIKSVGRPLLTSSTGDAEGAALGPNLRYSYVMIIRVSTEL